MRARGSTETPCHLPQHMNIKILIKDNLFPAPLEQVGDTTLLAEDKALVQIDQPMQDEHLQSFYGYEEDSNPRRLGRRDTRGGTGVSDYFWASN